MKMKILVVEDAAIRKEWFEIVTRGHDLTVTDNVDVVCHAILTEKFNEIWLDHDLGASPGQWPAPGNLAPSNSSSSGRQSSPRSMAAAHSTA